jgi:hypothetical protein
VSGGEEFGPLDPAGIFTALKHHRVRYVIIGGVAAQLHGSPAPTRGLDVTPERSAPNLARLAAALASVEAQEWVPGFGYPLQLPMDRRRLAGDRVLMTQTRYGRVDVVPSPHGVPAGYDELESRAQRVTAYGAELPVACLDDLIRSHGAASRAKDKVALARLIDLRLSTQDRTLPAHLPRRPAPPVLQAAAPALHEALAASECLAVVFDEIRPQLAHVRRELYRAVDSVMYGDAASTRDAVDRAHHAASNAQADVVRLRSGDQSETDRSLQGVLRREGDPSAAMARQADQELRATLRLLTSVGALRDVLELDELRDRLIEARVHTATADNHLDLLQIHLEQIARGWDREHGGREQGRGPD